MFLKVVFGIISIGCFEVWLLLKYFGFVMLMKLKFFLFLFFCYLNLLVDGFDKLWDIIFILDLIWIFLCCIEICVFGKFVINVMLLKMFIFVINILNVYNLINDMIVYLSDKICSFK